MFSPFVIESNRSNYLTSFGEYNTVRSTLSDGIEPKKAAFLTKDHKSHSKNSRDPNSQLNFWDVDEFYSNLNAKYLQLADHDYKWFQGMHWYDVLFYPQSLMFTEMKIRNV